MSASPVVTGRNSNVRKTFRRRLGRFLNVLCTFNLRPVSTGEVTPVRHECNKNDTSECTTSETRVLHERRECNTSETFSF